NLLAVVRDGLFAWGWQRNWRRRDRARDVARAGVGEREVEREGAAQARLAAEADLAPQQSGQLPGNRQAQPRAAVLAAGAGIRLLKGLEDEPLLLRGDTDAGVADDKRNDVVRAAQRPMVRRPAAFGQPHLDRNLAL